MFGDSDPSQTELYQFLGGFDQVFNGALNIDKFYQEVSSSNVYKCFFEDPGREEVYQTGSLTSYFRNVCSCSFWASGITNLSNWKDISIVALFAAASIFMEVPTSIETTIALTAGTIIFNGVIDLYDANKTSKEMREVERAKGLRNNNSSLLQRANIKYIWPLYANMVLTMSLLGAYGAISMQESEDSDTSKAQYSASTALQNIPLLLSIVIPYIIRKFNVSFLQYRKDNVDLRAQKHHFDEILRDFYQSDRNESSSHGPMFVFNDIVEQILDHICNDERYLPMDLRTKIKDVAEFYVRNSDLANSLNKYPKFSEENHVSVAREQHVAKEKLGEIRRDFMGYLQHILDRFRGKLADHILRSKLVEDYLVVKPREEIEEILGRFGFSSEDINPYIRRLKSPLNDYNVTEVCSPLV